MNRLAAFPARSKLMLCGAAIAVLTLPAALASAQDAPAKMPELTAEQVTKGRQLFADWSCGGCHTLKDGDGTGSIGPSLDGNPRLDHALVVDRITNGSGPMPSFGGQIPDTDIALLASYVIQAKK
ncbi:MAG: cytochrome c [Croceibacterium sp.]